jgi:23S rRNA pseudouridine2605 synthase
VRNVLGGLGLTVTRLIRVSFGPFQLGEIAEGAVEEVHTQVLRDQLGARLVTLSGAEFSGPLATADAPQKPEAPRSAERKPASHAWRATGEERPRKLRRKFHGSRRDDKAPPERSKAKPRSEEIADRKGRRVAVERFGSPPPPPQEKPLRRDRHRRRAPDRAAGARPRRPRERN